MFHFSKHMYKNNQVVRSNEECRFCIYKRSCLLYVSSEVAQRPFWTVHRELSSSWNEILQCCGGAIYLSCGNKDLVKEVLTSVLVSITV